MPFGVTEFLQGRYEAPKSDLTPQEEAELRKVYMQMLQNLDVAELNLRMEEVESYSSVMSAWLSGTAHVASAYASIANAGANLELAEAARIVAELQPYVYAKAMAGGGLPNAAVQQAHQGRTEAGRATAVDRMRSNPPTNRSDAELALSGAFDDMLVNAGTDLNVLSSSLSARPYGAVEYVATRDAMVSDAKQKAASALVAAGVSPAEATQWAGTWADGTLGEALFIPSEVEKQAREERQEAANDSEMRRARIDAQSVGLPADVAAKVSAALDWGAGIDEMGMEGFSASIEDRPPLPNFEQSRAQIQYELENIGKADDPWGRAIAETFAIPGAADWAAAMGFNSLDRAAVYVSKHPDEFTSGVRFARDTPGATSQDIIRYQQEQGYPVSPVQRLFRLEPTARRMARQDRRAIRQLDRAPDDPTMLAPGRDLPAEDPTLEDEAYTEPGAAAPAPAPAPEAQAKKQAAGTQDVVPGAAVTPPTMQLPLHEYYPPKPKTQLELDIERQKELQKKIVTEEIQQSMNPTSRMAQRFMPSAKE